MICRRGTRVRQCSWQSLALLPDGQVLTFKPYGAYTTDKRGKELVAAMKECTQQDFGASSPFGPRPTSRPRGEGVYRIRRINCKKYLCKV